MNTIDVYIPVDKKIKSDYNISHWKEGNLKAIFPVEKKENVYVLTPQELEKAIKDAEDKAWTEGWCAGNNKTEEMRIAIGDAFDAGGNYTEFHFAQGFLGIKNPNPDKDQYLANLIKP